ncbi:MAG: M23 family metallopeptidase [Micrococcales bacterium]|nr:M23 family metallopeptidase [Micrococcales bacterium]
MSRWLAGLVLVALVWPASGSQDVVGQTDGRQPSGLIHHPDRILQQAPMGQPGGPLLRGLADQQWTATWVPMQPLFEAGLAYQVFDWPLPAPVQVVRVFDRPAHNWLAGHRGADLSGPSAAPVLAPAAGVISYNGWIVDRRVLVIDHGDLRSTLEPVVSELVVGATVLRGQAVGKLATDQASHCQGCLHWGVRRGQDYLDPLSLLRASPRAVLWE